jgi:hypothetical protein
MFAPATLAPAMLGREHLDRIRMIVSWAAALSLANSTRA